MRFYIFIISYLKKFFKTQPVEWGITEGAGGLIP